jgi:hypothetical protein
MMDEIAGKREEQSSQKVVFKRKKLIEPKADLWLAPREGD